MANWPRAVPSVVQAMRVGSLGVAAMPGEVFVEIGLNVKARGPFRPTMMIELANYRGYIPAPERHRLGGYETWRAKVELS